MEDSVLERQPSPDCLFCRIVGGELDADVVAQTEDLLAFNDLNPQAPRHILIIPKAHIPTTNDLVASEAELVGNMVLLARKIAEDDFADAGYRLVLNTNRQAGQTVFHLHLHVLAGRYLNWPPG